MSRHTIVNLKQIEASEGARANGVDAHFGRSHLDSEHLGVSYFRYPPDSARRIGHHHREQEEAYVVVAGSGQVRLDDEVFDLDQWDVVRVAPDVVRGFRAGPDGLEVIAVGSDRPEGGDGAMVKDWWTECHLGHVDDVVGPAGHGDRRPSVRRRSGAAAAPRSSASAAAAQTASRPPGRSSRADALAAPRRA